MRTKPVYYEGLRSEMVHFLPENYATVLEIGCGKGNFRQNLQPDLEYWGVEPVATVAEEARQKLSHVLVGTYAQAYARLPDHYFDLVICNDVIEHFVDHDFFFQSIKRKMKPEARLVGSVPNVRYYRLLYALLIKKDWRYKDDGVLDRSHLRFFTAKSLARTLREHGFAIERLQGINSGIRRLNSPGKVLRWIRIRLLELLSLGYFRDIKYLQFAFRARMPSPGRHDR